MPSRFVCSIILALSAPALAQLQTPPRPPAPVYTAQDVAAVNATVERFGFDFVTVGAPGNRSWLPKERRLPSGGDPNLIDDRGRVDYSYRILRTEVVQTQYVDFLQAFRPYWLSIENIPGHVESGSPTDSSVTGRGISIFGGFDINHAYDNSAMTISWRNAARYCNWLHNGAPTDPDSITWDTFNTGAYTFTDESFGSNIHGNPVTRNEGARFWLPGLDELIKAAYYDPNRYGEGEEGYWPYPHSSEETPVPMVGQPGGDYGAPDINGDGHIQAWESLRAGYYPDTASPWGLLDVLGTEPEWTETPYGVFTLDGVLVPNGRRMLVGNFFAEIDDWRDSSSTFGSYAFRLATIVPAPIGCFPLAFAALCALRPRSRPPTLL